jgi:hypothetical protein
VAPATAAVEFLPGALLGQCQDLGPGIDRAAGNIMPSPTIDKMRSVRTFRAEYAALLRYIGAARVGSDCIPSAIAG